MSTTNGAGEPSMEEILASIRNIIAQEPPVDGDTADEIGARPAEPLAARERGAASGGPRLPTPGAVAPGGPASHTIAGQPTPGPRLGQPHKQASTASPQRTMPGSDDFSDVFEEPLQRLPGSPAPRSGGPGAVGEGAPVREPTLPSSALASSKRAPDQELSQPTLPEPGKGAFEGPDKRAKGRDGFDFGMLRPPREGCRNRTSRRRMQPSRRRAWRSVWPRLKQSLRVLTLRPMQPAARSLSRQCLRSPIRPSPRRLRLPRHRPNRARLQRSPQRRRRRRRSRGKQMAVLD